MAARIFVKPGLQTTFVDPDPEFAVHVFAIMSSQISHAQRL